MKLELVQQALARLLTDGELRARWRRRPEQVAAELGLQPEEASYLAGLEAAQVDGFATGLIWKRLRACEHLLPRSRQLLGKRFAELFFEFAATYLPVGRKKHRSDAIEFSRWLEKLKAPSKEIDMTRFEAAWLEARASSYGVQRRHFHHALPEVGLPLAGATVIWLRWQKRLVAFRVWPAGPVAGPSASRPLAVEGLKAITAPESGDG